MEPKIVTLGALCLVGLPYYGNPEGGAFGQAWDRFQPLQSQVTGRVNPKIYYGLEVYGEEFMQDNRWLYMPAVEARDLAEMPALLFGKVLPPCTYAVFTARHGIASIPETFKYAMEEWMPGSKYAMAYPFDFELYDDDRFQGDGPDAEIDVYIPIREKAA